MHATYEKERSNQDDKDEQADKDETTGRELHRSIDSDSQRE